MIISENKKSKERIIIDNDNQMNNNMNPNTIKSNIDKGIKKYCR